MGYKGKLFFNILNNFKSIWVNNFVKVDGILTIHRVIFFTISLNLRLITFKQLVEIKLLYSTETPFS